MSDSSGVVIMSSVFSKFGENPQYAIYRVALNEKNVAELVSYLIKLMEPGDEFSVTYLPFDDFAIGDCSRELKKLGKDAFQAKQGMHGSRGSWRNITSNDAVEWLESAVRRNFELLGTHERCVYQLKSKRRDWEKDKVN